MANQHVIDVGEAEFAAAVEHRSEEVPVLVDFWAPWCGPCRILGPMLEKLAVEMAGAFVLAKVNTDESPALAQRFGIRGIPNVKLFRGGTLVDEFVGALPEAAVRSFLQRHCPSPADELASEGDRLMAAGARDQALAAYRRALELDSGQPAANVALASAALADGDREALQRHVRAIPASAPQYDRAQYLIEAQGLADEGRAAGGLAVCQQAVASASDDLDARFALGCCLTMAGQYRRALDEFLRIVEIDRRYRDEAARKAMLTVFGLVGIRSELADEYRRKLSILI
jgi:putative thioredoxin